MQALPEAVRPSEAVVRCHKCGEALVLPKRRSNSPPFCSKPDCRKAYARWRYHNAPGVKEKMIDAVMRRRAQAGLGRRRR